MLKSFTVSSFVGTGSSLFSLWWKLHVQWNPALRPTPYTATLLLWPFYYGPNKSFLILKPLYYGKPVNTTRFCRLLVTGLTGFHFTLDDYMYMYTGVSERLPYCLSFCLSVCLSVYMYMSVCLFINNHSGLCHSVCLLLPVHLSVCQSVSLSIYQSVCPFDYLSAMLSCCYVVCLPVCKSVPLSVGQSLSLSVCLSVCLYVCMSVCMSISLSVS